MIVYFCRIIKNFLVTKGDAFSTEIVKQEAELSPEMIQRFIVIAFNVCIAS